MSQTFTTHTTVFYTAQYTSCAYSHVQCVYCNQIIDPKAPHFDFHIRVCRAFEPLLYRLKRLKKL